MGCALAFQLAKRDVDVILLERETLGSQSTGKCAGGVRQQFSMPANVSLQRLSVRLFENFEAETGHPADFRQLGYLFVLTLPQQVEDFRHNMEMWHSLGLTEARWVDATEAARMVPVLNVDDVLGCNIERGTMLVALRRWSRSSTSTTCSVAPTAPPTASPVRRT